jgi:hypothetical protein
MNRIRLFVLAFALVTWRAPLANAQPHEPAHDPAPAAEHDGAAGREESTHDASAHDTSTHEGAAHDAGPVVPDTRHRWPAPTVFVIGISFFMALVIGLIVRAHAPPEMPPTHSHDEPPGASHHHGESGTINPVPEDVAELERGDAHGHGHDHGHHH